MVSGKECIRMPQIRPPQVPAASRVLIGVFGCVFGGAGLCMLALIWGGESDFVPVPARLFGSLICVAFLAFGGFMVFGAIAGGKAISPSIDLPDAPAGAPSTSANPAGYHCPHCAAALGEKADVSPMGDVKCAFCGRWFNVHGKG
jgi:hypothetical protein